MLQKKFTVYTEKLMDVLFVSMKQRHHIDSLDFPDLFKRNIVLVERQSLCLYISGTFYDITIIRLKHLLSPLFPTPVIPMQ